MKSSIEEKEQELIGKREYHLRQIEIIESNLQLLNDFKPKSSHEVFTRLDQAKASTKQLLELPSVSINESFVSAIKTLRQFTRNDLGAWVRNKYPNLNFSDKSSARPLRAMMEKGEVIMIKPNQGNKTPAVYEYKGK
jgi:hypothetical protein